ncbi:hypothetical protein ABGB18_38895 [Nonomuraea sp. B12E4]|uniref:hypothetical protein n=1 Tax=Nonomuraea sp. B12E4 TaxID=3153564 RepID=UPI00325DA9B6
METSIDPITRRHRPQDAEGVKAVVGVGEELLDGGHAGHDDRHLGGRPVPWTSSYLCSGQAVVARMSSSAGPGFPL